MRLSLDRVSKTFAGHRALHKVALEVSDVHCLVLIGPSGSGKSTLLRILGGLELPDSGSVAIDGQPLPTGEAPLQAYRRTVGTVFQAVNLFPHLTALANITVPLEKVHGMLAPRAREIALDHLRRFRVEEQAHKRPAEMSGGQRQRVAIARALSIRPRLLLFDEPTSALDPETTSEVLQAIEELRAEQRDIILATHQLAFARCVADHVVFLAEGEIRESGPTLFDAPQHLETREFLAKILRY